MKCRIRWENINFDNMGTLTISTKFEFNFEVTLYITILVFLSPGTHFKSAICYQTSISKEEKEGKILHQKGLRSLYCLIFHSDYRKERTVHFSQEKLSRSTCGSRRFQNPRTRSHSAMTYLYIRTFQNILFLCNYSGQKLSQTT